MNKTLTAITALSITVAGISSYLAIQAEQSNTQMAMTMIAQQAELFRTLSIETRRRCLLDNTDPDACQRNFHHIRAQQQDLIEIDVGEPAFRLNEVIILGKPKGRYSLENIRTLHAP